MHQKMRLTPVITITTLQVEYYSCTEQQNFRPDEHNLRNSSIQYFRLGHYFLDIQYIVYTPVQIWLHMHYAGTAQVLHRGNQR